jgi:hypothetical protein
MGLRLKNLGKVFQFNDRNTEVLMKLREGKDPSEPDDAAEADDMRIDSDNIQNHYHYQQPWVPKPASPIAPLGSSLLKIGLGAALAGTGVGGMLALPSIISGVSDLMKPAAVAPAEPGAQDAPTINIGGTEYQLNLGKEDQ